MPGDGIIARVGVVAGESISFVLRDEQTSNEEYNITTEELNLQQSNTLSFWHNFIAQSKYKGQWMEAVTRSLMILKMMTYGELTEFTLLVYLLIVYYRADWRYNCSPDIFNSRAYRRRAKLGLQILLGS